MKYAEFVKNSPEYKIILGEAQNPAYGYLFVSKDGIFSDVLCKLFLAKITGVDLQRLESPMADIEVFDGKFNVSDAEKIIEKAYYTPIELEKKYFILKCGENINEAAQNKLLKLLEEPPKSTAFVIITKEESYLLPTVRSRLKIIRCRPLDEGQMEELCKTYFGNSNLSCALSGGSIERAEKFALAEYNELYREIINLLFNMQRSGDILGYASFLNTKREMLNDVLDVFEAIFHDCMMCSVNKYDSTVLKRSLSEIKQLSIGYNTEVVLKLRPVLNGARQRLAINGNALSVIDEFLFKILEVKAKCQK